MPTTCPNGHENPDGAAYCNRCGQPIEAASATTCSRGHENPEGSSFCITCGEPLTAGQRPAPSASLAPPLSSQPLPPRTPPPPPPLGAPGPSPARRRRRWVPVVAVLATLAAVAAFAAAYFLTRDDDDGDFEAGDQLRGVALLFDEEGDIDGEWDTCQGTGGYSDFSAGMRLSIKGSDGEVVGSGDVTNVDESMLDTLSTMNDDIGWLSDEEESPEEIEDFLSSSEGFSCVLYFEGEIEDSDFYSIELGQRGDLSFSREELEKDNFTVSMSIGM